MKTQLTIVNGLSIQHNLGGLKTKPQLTQGISLNHNLGGLIARHSFARMFLLAAILTLFAQCLQAPPADAAPEVTFLVNSTKNIGDDEICNATECTLEEAITAANATAATDKIKFHIPAAADPGCVPATGICTIQIDRALPEITTSMTIDGYSQPGAILNTQEVGTNAKIKIVLRGNGPLEPSSKGLVLAAGKSTIRGLSLINFTAAIYIESNENHIFGNFIGVLPDGVTLSLNSSGVMIYYADATQIGAPQLVNRNLITGNSFSINVNGGKNTRIRNNYIGTTKSGAPAGDAGHAGVNITSGATLSVGGYEEGEGNVIGGFTGDQAHGIYITNPNKFQIVGNSIGVSADGKTPLPNTIGIWVASTNYDFDTHPIARNQIAHNQEAGVLVTSGSRSITISQNSIFKNGGLGIDLDNGGVLPNDPLDVDGGSNDGQNYPVLNSVQPSAVGTFISGKLDSTPKTTFRIEFFTSPNCDGSGNGEGKNYLGEQVVTTGANGKVNFAFNTDKILLNHTPVTATATSAAGNGKSLNTSEFSKCKAAK